MVGLSSPDRGARGRLRAPGLRRAAILLLCLPAAASAAERVGTRDGALPERREAEQVRLERIRSEIEDLRQRLARTESTAGSVLDAIEELDLRMALLAREAESLREDAHAALRREEETRRDAEEIGRRIAASERSLQGFLREVYKVGPTRYVRVATASSSPAQFAAGQRAVEALGLGEARRIDAYRADHDRLDAVLIDLEEQGEERARIERALASKDRELRDSRGRKEAVLAGLRREQASQRSALLELVGLEKEIEGLLQKLERPGGAEPVPSLGFARYHGLLAWPARGRLAIPFGKVRHPRFSTVVPHPGIDIASPVGQAIRTVFDGRVVFSDWFRGYGEMVVIDHGDGYLSIYGHVSERLVAVGESVRQGDLIARSGEGGAFDIPGLYFEIRHDGKAEDPAQWLRSVPGRAPGRPATRSGGRAHRSGP